MLTVAAFLFSFLNLCADSPRDVSVSYTQNDEYCQDETGVVMSGGSYLVCKAEGNPAPTLSWACDDGAASHSECHMT